MIHSHFVFWGYIRDPACNISTKDCFTDWVEILECQKLKQQIELCSVFCGALEELILARFCDQLDCELELEYFI